MSDNEDLMDAHQHSINHRTEIMGSEICGCFHCLAIFEPVRIEAWIDENENGQGQTALCPKCGIDSVIGLGSGHSITKTFLRKMNSHWF